MMKCILCLTEHKIIFGEEDGWVGGVSSGVVCVATGNFGSAIFDSHGGEVMQFLVCDECLKNRGDLVNVFRVRKERPKVHRIKKTLAEYVASDFEMDYMKFIDQVSRFSDEEPDDNPPSEPLD